MKITCPHKITKYQKFLQPISDHLLDKYYFSPVNDQTHSQIIKDLRIYEEIYKFPSNSLNISINPHYLFHIVNHIKVHF